MPDPNLPSTQSFIPQTSFGGQPSDISLGGFNVNEALRGVADLSGRVAANFAPDPRIRASRQQQIQQQTAQQQQLTQAQIQASVERFKGVSQMITAIGQSTGGQIPPSIMKLVDNETKLLSAYLGQAGMDPQQALQMREQALAAAQIPGTPEKPVALSPGQQLVLPSTGETVAGVEAAPDSYTQKIQAMEVALGRPLSEQEKLQVGNAVAAQAGFSLTVDPSTGQVSLTQGGGGGAPGGGIGTGGAPGGIPIGTPPAALVQETGERLKYLDSAIADIDTLVGIGSQPGAQFGTVGTIKKDLREIVRVVKEGTAGELGAVLSGPLQKLGGYAESMIGSEVREGLMDPDVAADLLAGDPLTSAADLEKRLAYFYARTLQPDGKLLADTIETAKSQTKIFSLFKSEQTAIEQLLSLRQGMVAARNNLSQSAPGFQGQPPVENAGTETGAIPEGLPAGSTKTGEETIDGLEVWQAPDGKKYVVE